VSRWNPEESFAALVKAFVGRPGVTFGSPGPTNQFGSSALKIDGRIFAMVSAKRLLVVKLPSERVDALVAIGIGIRSAGSRGRPLREWLALEPGSAEHWLEMAGEAMEFVVRKPNSGQP
jgi:hypothetical protein